jgi:hypothetical protein
MPLVTSEDTCLWLALELAAYVHQTGRYNKQE